ncbi:hypothetical protein M947_02915 [Sulfurimonas hongkongensis]|uniref:Pyridoxamine 5'-phosphate oxidase N-terminal domain-containing protein n=1 Tax=Sulfurimonas hongkongensis TaxID=1172190 RepID=T0JFX5_9BACT|nr:pyridoxamine 5'-phosphate oxidase family protein [Sulfurimonas hongkongensis]EQB39990.1 hypothetical protein M947_02915 [Sulfurimonas hongkongensis]
MSDLEKIESFISKHHALSLATSDGDELSVCSLFYIYDGLTFVVASSEDTTHIKHIKKNQNVAGNILLETKEVGKIQGLQFRGVFRTLGDEKLKKLYFKRFPYALAMRAKLYKIEVKYFKLTDNRLGFGKKIIWKEP